MIRAVVFDTNAFNHGKLDLEDLARWSGQLAELGLETWIPEPVLWEFVEHALADARTAAAALESSGKAAAKAGLKVPGPYQPPTLEEAERLVRQALEALPGMVVVPLSGPAAREALRDQLLLRGAGERVPVESGRKKARTVKTGAADSAIVRAAHSHARKRSGSYVIVSGDRDIAKVYEAQGWNPPVIYKNYFQASKNLRPLNPGTDEVKRAILGLLDAIIGEPDSDDWHSGPTEYDASLVSLGRNLRLSPDLSDQLEASSWHSPAGYEDDITHLTALIDVRDVEFDEDAQLAFATVVVQGHIERSTWTWDDMDDRFETEATSAWHVILVAPLTVQFSAGRAVRAHNDTDEIDVWSSDDRFQESDEAFDAVMHRLGPYTHDELPPDSLLTEGAATVAVGGDQALTLSLDGDVHSGDWTLTVRAGAEPMSVVCFYDVDAWIGGREGRHIEPPYVLRAEGGDDRVVSPLSRLSAFLLRRVESPPDEPAAGPGG